MTPQQFKTRSDVSRKPRSSQLKKVDAALTTYDHVKTKHTLYALANAILAWRATKQNWTTSIRKAAMIDLINYVKAEALRLAPSSGYRVFNHCQAKTARDEMLGNPRRFLKKNRISIAGEDDGQMVFYVWVDSGDLIFENQLLPPTAFSFPIKGYKLSTSADYGAKLRNTMSIKMHPKVSPTSAADVTNKLVPLAGNLVVTGMLTACCFVIRNLGGVSATHLQPSGDGNALQDTVAGYNIPGVTLYGKRDYTTSYTHVIGFNTGSWHFYAQRCGEGTVIVDVDKIPI